MRICWCALLAVLSGTTPAAGLTYDERRSCPLMHVLLEHATLKKGMVVDVGANGGCEMTTALRHGRRRLRFAGLWGRGFEYWAVSPFRVYHSGREKNWVSVRHVAWAVEWVWHWDASPRRIERGAVDGNHCSKEVWNAASWAARLQVWVGG